MSRPKGSKNKQALAVPDTVLLSTEGRIEFIASLIVDRIAMDETDGFVLLQTIKASDGTKQAIA